MINLSDATGRWQNFQEMVSSKTKDRQLTVKETHELLDNIQHLSAEEGHQMAALHLVDKVATQYGDKPVKAVAASLDFVDDVFKSGSIKSEIRKVKALIDLAASQPPDGPVGPAPAWFQERIRERLKDGDIKDEADVINAILLEMGYTPNQPVNKE